MKRLLIAVFAALLPLAVISNVAAVPVQWTVASGGNGHWYELVSNPSLSWDSARANAQASNANGLNWDLATITSQGEQLFIQKLIPVSLPQTSTGVVEYWVGGYQQMPATEPAGNWNWINGEGLFWNSGTTGMYANSGEQWISLPLP